MIIIGGLLVYLIFNWIAGIILVGHYASKNIYIQWGSSDKWLLLFPIIGWGLFLHQRRLSSQKKWWLIYDRMIVLHYWVVGFVALLSVLFFASLLIAIGDGLAFAPSLDTFLQAFSISIPVWVFHTFLFLILIFQLVFLVAVLLYIPYYLKKQIESNTADASST